MFLEDNCYNPLILILKMQLKAILRYFDLFDYPLTKEELLNFTQIKPEEWANPEIQEKNGYYFLNGREKIIETRIKREEYAKQLWLKTYFYLRILKYLPFLKMVAVCNTLAFNHPEKESDIDLFIVTSKNRLWIARILTTFCLQLLGVRRHGNKISGRFCLSFWCTEDAINLEQIQIKPLDPYLAFWCLTLKPVLDNNLYEKFIEENSLWIKNQYSLNFKKEQKSAFYQTNFIGKFLEFLLKEKFGNFLEAKIKKILKPRTEKKATKANQDSSLIISDTMLKFHNKDKRAEIVKKWQKN